MRLLDRAKEAFGDAAEVVSRETEVLTLKAKVAKLELDLQRQLLEVGKAAFALWKQGGCKSETTNPALQKAADIEAKIAATRAAAGAARPGAKPAAKPATKAATKPTVKKAAAKPAVKPATKAATKSATKPAAKPKTKKAAAPKGKKA